ncbi:beta-galactosidase [Agromyces atrinae]|uniref:Beta-galactosidase n=1 Tax=Agromyces atrinae TaxID=592376 RepID=A0A4Q2M0G6_9MICO|nr:beta-galactosidase [Agromyces atrinae]NYD68435.1 beta-galactosidase [Agromyces atrinae]RXZ85179.1 beta-galactosidase [Agromyces atrinae]
MEHPARRFEHEGIAFGCDYNPEQWDPAVWPEDIRLMQEAGVDLVAINVFGWSHIEPRAGEYDFAALDAIIEQLHTAGIRVNLGTGTSSPPPWLTTAHPELLPVAEDGTRRFPGGRQAWCPSSPVFREAALRLVDAVAERYGSHPAVALWHVSNELGCHNALCYCDESAASFRRWLEARYGTIDALNDAWGTGFWSQRYGAWAEILPPRATLSTRNPGQLLDFQRFSSDELLAYYRAEVEVLARRSDIPATTNFMVTAHIKNLDYWSWAGAMDVIANDHYLDHRLADPRTELSFAADLTRGLAEGAPWLLMEHSTGAVNWQPINRAKEPGQLARNSLTHVARGADAVCFFQWRASVQGSEKFHSALLPHAGTDSTLWREVVELGRVIESLGEIAGTRVDADVAVLFSWESWWATDTEMRPSHELGYLDQVHAAYGAVHALGITVDVVAPGSDLSGYRLVVIPGLHLVSDADAASIDAWVRSGGTALVTFYSGIVDEDDRVRTGGYPGAFRETLGVAVEEFAPVAADEPLTLDSGASASLWTERSRVTTAEVVDRFVDGPSAGFPALTRNERGEGEAWYLATLPSADAYRDIVARLADDADIRPPARLMPESAGAEPTLDVVRRRSDDASYLFVINHGTDDVLLEARGDELVTGTSCTGTLTAPAGAVRIIREEQVS